MEEQSEVSQSVYMFRDKIVPMTEYVSIRLMEEITLLIIDDWRWCTPVILLQSLFTWMNMDILIMLFYNNKKKK